jgi:hypothetical protein
MVFVYQPEHILKFDLLMFSLDKSHPFGYRKVDETSWAVTG